MHYLLTFKLQNSVPRIIDIKNIQAEPPSKVMLRIVTHRIPMHLFQFFPIESSISDKCI